MNVVGDCECVVVCTLQIWPDLHACAIASKSKVDAHAKALDEGDGSSDVRVASRCQPLCPHHGLEWRDDADTGDGTTSDVSSGSIE